MAEHRAYEICSETGLHHGCFIATSELDALTKFNADGNERDSERGHIVQCGQQKPYLDIGGFTFCAYRV